MSERLLWKQKVSQIFAPVGARLCNLQDTCNMLGLVTKYGLRA
jgi:hypothetical protein